MFNIEEIIDREHEQTLQITDKSLVLPESTKIEKHIHCAIQGTGSNASVELTEQCDSLEMDNHRQLYLSTLCDDAEKKTLNINLMFNNRISTLVMHKARSQGESGLSILITFPEARSVEAVIVKAHRKRHKSTTSYKIDVVEAARLTQEKLNIYFSSNNPTIKRDEMTISLLMETSSGDTTINSACSSLGLLSITALSVRGDVITDEQTSRTSRRSRLREPLQNMRRQPETLEREEPKPETTVTTITTTEFNLEEKLELETRGRDFTYEFDDWDYRSEFSEALQDLSDALSDRKRRDIMSFVALGSNYLSYKTNKRAINVVRKENIEINDLQKQFSEELEREIVSITIEEDRQRKEIQERISELCELDQKIEMNLIKTTIKEELNFMTIKLLRQESNGGKYSAAHTAAVDLCAKMGSFPEGCAQYYDKQPAQYQGITPVFAEDGSICLEIIFLAMIPKISYLGTAISVLSTPIPLGRIKDENENGPNLFSYMSIDTPKMIIRNRNEVYDITNCITMKTIIFCTNEALTRSNAQNYCAQSLLQREKHPSCPSTIITTTAECLGKMDSKNNLLVSGFRTPIRLGPHKDLQMGRNFESESKLNGTIQFFATGETMSTVHCGQSWWSVPKKESETKVINLELKTRQGDRIDTESSYIMKNSKLNENFKESKYYNSSNIKLVKEKLDEKLSISQSISQEITSWSTKTKVYVFSTLAVVGLIVLCVMYFRAKQCISNARRRLPCLGQNERQPVPKRRRSKPRQDSSRDSALFGI